MPQRKDLYHKQALRALQNDGWTITYDLFKFRFGFPATLPPISALSLAHYERHSRAAARSPSSSIRHPINASDPRYSA
jgi:hypothetical protein